MEIYQTDVSRIEIVRPIFIGYKLNGEARVVNGGIRGHLHLGQIQSDKPHEFKAPGLDDSISFGVLELFHIWLPYAEGQDAFILNGPVFHRVSLTGTKDWDVIEAADVTTMNYIASLNADNSNLPQLCLSQEQAQEFVENNPELAETYTKHYKQALEVTNREIRVGIDENGNYIKPTEEQLQAAAKQAENSGLQAPNQPVNVSAQQSKSEHTVTNTPPLPENNG